MGGLTINDDTTDTRGKTIFKDQEHIRSTAIYKQVGNKLILKMFSIYRY